MKTMFVTCLRRIEQLHLAHLSGDLEHLEIARESHRARRAERALESASRLRRNAERQARSFGNRDGLDELSVVEPEQKLLGAVVGGLTHRQRQPRNREVLVEEVSESDGQVGHRCK